MDSSLEQRYVKFYVRLGKNATKIFQMLQEVFREDCISRSQSGRRHKAFKEGREMVVDERRSGRPTTVRADENVTRVSQVLRSNRRLSIQQIADTLNLSTLAVHGVLTEDLQMQKVCARGLTSKTRSNSTTTTPPATRPSSSPTSWPEAGRQWSSSQLTAPV